MQVPRRNGCRGYSCTCRFWAMCACTCHSLCSLYLICAFFSCIARLVIEHGKAIFITLGGYIFLGQMVSVGNYRGVVSSRDKIFYVGPSTHTWGYGKFVNARYARFTNSNAKLRLRLRLHLDFLPSLRSGKKPAIRPRAFIRPYIN